MLNEKINQYNGFVHFVKFQYLKFEDFSISIKNKNTEVPTITIKIARLIKLGGEMINTLCFPCLVHMFLNYQF